jgi:hypothetical protein
VISSERRVSRSSRSTPHRYSHFDERKFGIEHIVP